MLIKGNNLTDAIKKTAQSESNLIKPIEKKIYHRRFSVLAPMLRWGTPEPIFTYIGPPDEVIKHVVDEEWDDSLGKLVPVYEYEFIPHVAKISVSFDITSSFLSTFEYYITGGDEDLHDIGPGSDIVTVTGNVATELMLSCKSHSVPLTITGSVRY